MFYDYELPHALRLNCSTGLSGLHSSNLNLRSSPSSKFENFQVQDASIWKKISYPLFTFTVSQGQAKAGGDLSRAHTVLYENYHCVT